ncbi:MAG: primosomal replication protein N [Methylotenera sp.]
MNNLLLSGVVISLEPIRYTPAGIPLLSFVLQHASEQTEAGLKRKVECEVNAVALGDIAKQNIQLGSSVKAKGFLAKRSAKSTQLVLHIEKLEIQNI